jgi:hypothetical protein
VKNETPIIIWTHRRCGGTNLAAALFKSSNYTPIQHEPFNVDRCFGEMQTQLADGSYRGDLISDVRRVLKSRPLIKHCLEIIHKDLNDAIIEVTNELDYKHLFLYRELATDRLLSLNYALLTGIWGSEQKIEIDENVFSEAVNVKSLISHEEHCRREMARIHSILIENSSKPISVSFEMLYRSNFEYSCLLVKDIFLCLGVDGSILSEEFLSKTLKGGGQGTKNEYRRFNRADELEQKSKSLGRFTLYTELDFTFDIDVVSSEINFLELWSPLPSVQSGKYHYLGVLVCDEDIDYISSDIKELFLALDKAASPRIGAMYPDIPNSNNSRFISNAFNPITELLLVSVKLEKVVARINISVL